MAPLELELCDALIGRLAVRRALPAFSLPAASADSHAINHIALLSAVSQSPGLLWAGGSRGPVYLS